MESVGSVHSATYPYFEQYHFSVRRSSNLSKINFNIILPSTSKYSKWSLFFSFSHQSPVCTSPSHRTCYMCRTFHSSLSARPNRLFGEEYRVCNPSLCSLSRFPVTSSLLAPGILLSTLFSNTLCVSSYPNVSDRVSHPYKTIDTIIFLYTNLYIYIYLSFRASQVYNIRGVFQK